MEENLCCKTTFEERQPLLEDSLWWKTTFNGRRPLMEDDLWWKMTFKGRRPLTEDNLWWKTTFGGKRPSMEDVPLWKMTLYGRWPSMEENLQWKMTSYREISSFAQPYTNIVVIFKWKLGSKCNIVWQGLVWLAQLTRYSKCPAGLRRNVFLQKQEIVFLTLPQITLLLS